jgi:hypothetical protein
MPNLKHLTEDDPDDDDTERLMNPLACIFHRRGALLTRTRGSESVSPLGSGINRKASITLPRSDTQSVGRRRSLTVGVAPTPTLQPPEESGSLSPAKKVVQTFLPYTQRIKKKPLTPIKMPLFPGWLLERSDFQHFYRKKGQNIFELVRGICRKR